jgi:hypothetical protein
MNWQTLTTAVALGLTLPTSILIIELTVEVGHNCDAFVQSAAARDMNYQDNLTERYRIKVERRGQQVDRLLETQ